MDTILEMGIMILVALFFEKISLSGSITAANSVRQPNYRVSQEQILAAYHAKTLPANCIRPVSTSIWLG
jgi:hypothetical protein